MSYSTDTVYPAAGVAARAAFAAAEALGGAGRELVAAYRRGQLRRRTLRELSRLDDRALADIGLTRGSIHSVVDGLIR